MEGQTSKACGACGVHDVRTFSVAKNAPKATNDKKFVPGRTGWLRQMGVIVVTIKLFSLVLQQPILIGWD